MRMLGQREWNMKLDKEHRHWVELLSHDIGFTNLARFLGENHNRRMIQQLSQARKSGGQTFLFTLMI